MTTRDWPSGLRDRTGLSSRIPLTSKPGIVADRVLLDEASREPLRGVLSPTGLVTGLYDDPHGTDTSAVADVAQSYLSALSVEDLGAGRFPLQDRSRRHWANPAVNLLRHGVLLEGLDPTARERALDVARACLSESGWNSVLACMRLNRTIGEIRGEVDELNEWLYWFSLYGDPQPSQPWAWQLDGHHVNVNCTVVDGRLVVTPTFLGAEPVAAFAGQFEGTWALQQEQDRGSALYVSLTASQRATATIGTEIPVDVITGAGRDNFELNYEGVPFSTFSPEQLALALDLIGVYVGRERSDSADVRMAEVRDHLAETYFGWIGEPNPDGVFYYRVHSPVILIEFEHSRGIMFDNDKPARNHIHTIVRTPNGNDYGQDYLRQHHERYHRDQPQGPASSLGVSEIHEARSKGVVSNRS